MSRLLLVTLLALTLGACAMLSPESVAPHVISEDNRVWVRRGPVLLRCADLASEGRPAPVCVVADGAEPSPKAEKSEPAPVRQPSRPAPSPMRDGPQLEGSPY